MIVGDLDFCSKKGDLQELHSLMLSYANEYAKCELQKILDVLRWATWHNDGIFACWKHGGRMIPYIGIFYVKRYIDKFAGDILKECEQRGDGTIYQLKNNHEIKFEITDEPDHGNLYIEIVITRKKAAEENLVPYAKAAALQEIMGLTKDQVIKKYNGRYQGRDGRRMDRWCEPDNMLLYRGFGFKLVCNDLGNIIDLQEVIL